MTFKLHFIFLNNSELDSDGWLESARISAVKSVDEKFMKSCKLFQPKFCRRTKKVRKGGWDTLGEKCLFPLAKMAVSFES
jgi:hypothetical protein